MNNNNEYVSFFLLMQLLFIQKKNMYEMRKSMIKFIYQYDKHLLNLCMSVVDQDQNQDLMHEMALFLYLLNEISRSIL
jgi:hypothetical protein